MASSHRQLDISFWRNYHSRRESFTISRRHQRTATNTVERINLFSHGNPGLIAFTGTIEPKSADVFLEVKLLLT